MRILFVHNRYRESGGEDVALKLESELMMERGHDVETLFFDNNELAESNDKWTTLTNAVSNPNSADVISRVILRFEPDIIHIHNLFFVASPSILEVAEQQKIPVVMTLHNFRLVCCNALMLRNGQPCEICRKSKLPLAGIFYKCYRNSTSASALVTAVTSFHKYRGTWQTKIAKYIVLTNFAKEKMVSSSLNVPSERLIVLPNFVKESNNPNRVGKIEMSDQLTNGPEYGIREDFFLFAGRLTLEKGIISLIKAFRNMPDIPLFIAGEGPDRLEAEYEARNSKNIRFLGSIDRENLQGLMEKCKAVIFPSIWYEGLPYVILESFCHGTPVIASKLGAMESVIQNGYNGLHFEAGNETDICRAVRQFCLDGSVMYQGARSSWKNNYGPENHYRNLINLYSSEIASYGEAI